MLIQCRHCKELKPENEFLDREDRAGSKYAFCNMCMDAEHRSPDWPPENERGGGLYPTTEVAHLVELWYGVC
jgi:hypothetical protein